MTRKESAGRPVRSSGPWSELDGLEKLFWFLLFLWTLVGLIWFYYNVESFLYYVEDLLFQVFAAGCVILALRVSLSKRALWGWCASVGLLSALAEGIGVATGLLFGEYAYTERFGPRLLGVPLAIPLAWIAVVGALCLLWLPFFPRRSGWTHLWFAFLIGVSAVVIDGMIEPMAVAARGYWMWQPVEGWAWYGAPLPNFITWFMLAAAFAYPFSLLATSNAESQRVSTASGKGAGALLLMGISFTAAVGFDGLWPAFWFNAVVLAGIVLVAVTAAFLTRKPH